MSEPKNRVTDLTIDWNRCIHVDARIDDTLIKKLLPQILTLRQESNLPITVAINSLGGSIAAAETLLGLITGPHQDKSTCKAITVSVHHAYSAAATLLASGDYSVALPNSDILFHDVRYGGMEDVTPTVARVAAAQLQEANDELALKLANRIFRRLVWNYIDIRKNFENIREAYSKKHEKYAQIIGTCGKGAVTANVDIASFATALFAKLSKSSEHFIDKTMDRLYRWGIMTKLSEAAPNYRAKGMRTPGLLDGSRHLFGMMRKAIAYKDGDAVWEKITPDLKIFLTLLIENTAKEKLVRQADFSSMLEAATEDYKLINSINDQAHFRTATRQLLRHKHIFFSDEALKKLESGDEKLRETALKEAMPTAKLFWHFCVLLCTELFNGEHLLSPEDAQLLGLVDEVGGGGIIESTREFHISQSS